MTPRELRVCRLFGLDAGETNTTPARDREWARASTALDRALRVGEVALVTGPSGAGKTRVLRSLSRRLGRRAVSNAPRRGPCDRRSVIEWFGGELNGSMKALALAGLAEAAVLVTPVRVLSAGQRHRLDIARCARRAARSSGTLIIDEFCSLLDSVTAEGVSGCLRRMIAGTRGRAVVATAREEVAHSLRPDVLLYLTLDGRWELVRR